jgi:hypothetical protein
MRRRVALALAVAVLALAHDAAAQPASVTPPDPSRPFEITDNSFLVEEAFNQESGVVQNIFVWARNRDGLWDATFTQEWPAPGMTHQFSYTVPFSGTGQANGVGDVLLNYRYQLRTEKTGGPAVAPRLSLILPTGRESDGLGDGVVGLQMMVPASRQLGDLYVHANAGYTWLPGVQRTTVVAGSGVWRVAPMFNLMLEAVGEVGDSMTVSPGFRGGWNFGERQVVIGAALPVRRAASRTEISLLTYFSYELPFR